MTRTTSRWNGYKAMTTASRTRTGLDDLDVALWVSLDGVVHGHSPIVPLGYSAAS